MLLLSGGLGYGGGQEGSGSEQEDFSSCGLNRPGHCVETKQIEGGELCSSPYPTCRIKYGCRSGKTVFCKTSVLRELTGPTTAYFESVMAHLTFRCLLPPAWPAGMSLLSLKLLNTALKPEIPDKMEEFELITEVLERRRKKNPFLNHPWSTNEVLRRYGFLQGRGTPLRIAFRPARGPRWGCSAALRAARGASRRCCRARDAVLPPGGALVPRYRRRAEGAGGRSRVQLARRGSRSGLCKRPHKGSFQRPARRSAAARTIPHSTAGPGGGGGGEPGARDPRSGTERKAGKHREPIRRGDGAGGRRSPQKRLFLGARPGLRCAGGPGIGTRRPAESGAQQRPYSRSRAPGCPRVPSEPRPPACFAYWPPSSDFTGGDDPRRRR